LFEGRVSCRREEEAGQAGNFNCSNFHKQE